MIRVLAGSNAFGLQHDLQKIIGKFIAEHGELAVERVDGEEVSHERIVEAIQALPFLVSKKLVVLRAPSAQKKFVEEVEKILSDIPETNDVIILEPKLDKRSVYYKYLKKKTELTEYAQPDENGLAAWLQREAKARGGNIGSNDARYLIGRVGARQQLLSNELDKLLLHDQQVTRSGIDLLTEPTPQSTIFELLEAAFAGRGDRVLQLYAEQRALKVEPQQIVAMIAWQLHILALLKTSGDRSLDEVAAEAKVSPFVLRKSQNIASKLPLVDLKAQIIELLDIDLRSKRSALDLDEALQNFLLKLTISS
ncbi:MAG: DNA polymerase III subunit delta [Candidatus Saccharimonadales bacterium]